MLVLGSVTMELNKYLLGVFEVFPWTLRSDVHAAQGISGPAVQASIEEVVRVAVVDLLNTVKSLSVKPILRLQG